MLSSVEIRTTAGSLLTLPLESVTEGYYIQEIRGLDPVKATIVSSSFSGVDGSQYQSSRREARNIVLSIGLEPDYTDQSVQGLRTRLYQYLMPKSSVQLRFIDDGGLQVNISGRVESLETALFTREPAVDISIICFDPDFVGLTPVVITGSTVSNEDEILVSYTGSVEAGFTFVINIDRTLTEFTIYQRLPDGTVKSMDFQASFVAGDVLTVSTVAGNKFVTLTRASTSSSLLYSLSPQAPFLEFEYGDNHIRVHAIGATIPYTITYMTRYGGL